MYFVDKISRISIKRLLSNPKFRRFRLAWRKRLGSFWLLAVIGIVGPWSCALRDKDTVSSSRYDISFKNQSDIKPEPPFTTRGDLCELESVYDGDTVWVRCNGQREKLRLYCIDAPEMQQKPWGKNSRDYLRTVLTSHVVVERMNTDRYGRTVARLFTMNGDDANLELIRTGNAVVYPKYCPANEKRYDENEVIARQTGKVVWGSPGKQSSPWNLGNRTRTC